MSSVKMTLKMMRKTLRWKWQKPLMRQT